MEFRNELVRRQDRLLDYDEAITLLINGEYGVLSINSEKGAYGIPLSYVWDGEDIIYFHCAYEGEKLRLLEVNPNVSFCIVGKTNVVSNKFTTGYESIILKGSIVKDLSEDEREKALESILDKYSPNDKVLGMQYSKKSFHRTNVIKLMIETFSGKCKKVK
jgi:hypothetical protein